MVEHEALGICIEIALRDRIRSGTEGIIRQLKNVIAFVSLWLCCIPCFAQSDRYELGKRVRRFELAWQTADATQRAASATPMQQAVKSFFSLQFTNAARELDQAYFIARTTDPPTAFEQSALAHRLHLQPVVMDSQSALCHFQLQAYYQPQSVADLDSAQVKLTLSGTDQQTLKHFELTWKSAAAGTALQLRDVPAGDYWLQVTIESGENQIPLPPMQVAVVSALDSRMQKLDQWLKAERAADQRTDELETIRLTVLQYTQTLRSQLEQDVLETDYPSCRLLKLAEDFVGEPQRAPELIRQQAPASIWMTISHNRKSLPVRVQTPALSAPAPADGSTLRPVLIAFHGAGGSENMFFETYGVGRLVELATQRGWIVVTPRHPLLGMPLSYREMIKVLSHFFPIDSARVFLVGHSMGAGEVVRQVALESDAPQAAVALGGGGGAKDTDVYRATPWFVAAGQLDFGRSGAKSLADRLGRFKCQVDYREYPNVEHMVIVQAALDDLFAFLDRQASK